MFGGVVRQSENGYNCSFCKCKTQYLSSICTHIVRNHTYTLKINREESTEHLRYFPDKKSILLAQELIDPAGITPLKAITTEPGWYVWYSAHSYEGIPLAEYFAYATKIDIQNVKKEIEKLEKNSI